MLIEREVTTIFKNGLAVGITEMTSISSLRGFAVVDVVGPEGESTDKARDAHLELLRTTAQKLGTDSRFITYLGASRVIVNSGVRS